ncbi:MAG: LysR family transcriptional regulator [Pseudomonadota bacterium]
MALLNYNHLRYFWAVAHEGNLTKAAQQLNVSQSALSVQIQKLEAQLGHPLFERVGRQLLLTEAGRIALEHADSIMASGDDLLETLSGQGAARQVLRVGALATLSRNFQLGFLQPAILREDVEIIIRSGALRDLFEQLEALRIDVLLSNMAPPRGDRSGWVAHPIDEQPVSLIGHRDRLGHDTARDPEALIRQHPVILPARDSGIRTAFDALAGRMNLQPRIAAEVDDMAMIRLLTRANAGLAVVPPIVVRDELETGLLIEAAELPLLRERFYAITPSRRFPNPLVRELVERAMPEKGASGSSANAKNKAATG